MIIHLSISLSHETPYMLFRQNSEMPSVAVPRGVRWRCSSRTSPTSPRLKHDASMDMLGMFDVTWCKYRMETLLVDQGLRERMNHRNIHINKQAVFISFQSNQVGFPRSLQSCGWRLEVFGHGSKFSPHNLDQSWLSASGDRHGHKKNTKAWAFGPRGSPVADMFHVEPWISLLI